MPLMQCTWFTFAIMLHGCDHSGINLVRGDLDRLSDEHSEYDPNQVEAMSECSEEFLY